jgi:hypothetical protein
MDLYIQFPIYLYGVVLNSLSTGHIYLFLPFKWCRVTQFLPDSVNKHNSQNAPSSYWPVTYTTLFPITSHACTVSPLRIILLRCPYLDNMASNCMTIHEWWIAKDLEGSRYCLDICLEGIIETMKHLGRCRRYLASRSNRTPPETWNESRTLQLQQLAR